MLVAFLFGVVCSRVFVVVGYIVLMLVFMPFACCVFLLVISMSLFVVRLRALLYVFCFMSWFVSGLGFVCCCLFVCLFVSSVCVLSLCV